MGCLPKDGYCVRGCLLILLLAEVLLLLRMFRKVVITMGC